MYRNVGPATVVSYQRLAFHHSGLSSLVSPYCLIIIMLKLYNHFFPFFQIDLTTFMYFVNLIQFILEYFDIF